MPWGMIGQIGSSIIGSRTQRKSDQRQNRANFAMARYAYSKDLEMWHRQNEYNTPKAQQERIKEAGLNPALMYGQGTVGEAQQMPQYNAPRMEYNDLPPVDPSAMLTQYQDFRQRSAQLDLTKGSIQLQQVTADLSNARREQVLNEAVISSVEATIHQKIMNDHLGDLTKIARGRIGGMKADDWYKEASAQVKQFHARLAKKGVNPNDNLIIRQLVEMFELFGFNTNSLKQSINIK